MALSLTSRKRLKLLTNLLVSLPLLLFLSVVILVSLMDFNPYRPYVEQWIEKHTGFPTKIRGDLTLDLFPLEIKVEKLRLKNPENFNNESFFTLHALQAQFCIWDVLFHQKMTLLGLQLNKPTLRLHRQASGVTNWQTLQQKLALTPIEGFHKVNLTVEDFRASSKAFLAELGWRFESLVMNSAQLDWQDDTKEQFFRVSDMELLALGVEGNTPFNVSLEFLLNTPDQGQAVAVNLSSQLKLTPDLTKWTWQDWNGLLKIQSSKELNLPELRLTTFGKFLQLNLANKTFAASQTGIEALGSQFIFTGKGELTPGLALAGTAALNKVNVPIWLNHLGFEDTQFVNQLALNNVNAGFDLAMDQQGLALNQMQISWDESTLKGDFWQFFDEDNRYEFDFHIDQLDVDAYQVKAKKSVVVYEDKNTRSSSGTDALLPETLSDNYLPLALPIDTLRTLNLAGQLQIDQLKIWQQQYQNFETTLDAQQGKIALAPLDASLYQGHMASKLSLNVTKETPEYHWSGKVKQVNLAPFLQDGWQYKKLKGTFSGVFDFKTQGVNAQLLKQNLNGSFLANLKDGAVQGVDLNKLLQGKKSSTKDFTAFESLLSQGRIQEGLYKVSKFQVKSQRFTAGGAGRLELAKAFLNADIRALILQPPKGLQALKNVQVPIQLKGKLGEVKWSINRKKLLKSPALKKNVQSLLLDSKS